MKKLTEKQKNRLYNFLKVIGTPILAITTISLVIYELLLIADNYLISLIKKSFED